MIKSTKDLLIFFTLLVGLPFEIVSNWIHRLFWKSPLGWQAGQFEARLCWYSDYTPTWKKWLLILGVTK